MVKNLLAVGSVFVVALALVALTFSATSEERADYILINGTEPKTLDPAKATGQPEGRVLEGLFEGLTFRHPRTLKPTPGAAERFVASPDGRKYVFHMRPGSKWSNGDPVTARDFVYSWRRFLTAELGAEYAYLLHLVRHGEAYNTYAGHVASLDATILPAFEKAVRDLPSGGSLAFDAFRKLLDETKSFDALVNPTDLAVRSALERESGAFTGAELSAFVEGLAAERLRRSEASAVAHEHLGVDQGFWASEDGTEFHVELTKYAPYFMDLTCFYPLFPVHRATVEAHPEDWFKPETIVTNGPFRMGYWETNRKIRLLRNEEHWDVANIALRHVDLLSIEHATTMMNLFLSNEVDWAPTGYPVELVDILKKEDYFYSNRGFIVYYYRLNVTKPPLDDVRVRKALALGFSRHIICDLVLKKGDLPSGSIVPPGVPGYEGPRSIIDLDRERDDFKAQLVEANRLLDEAGFPRDKDSGMRPSVKTLGIMFNTSEQHEKIAEYIAAEWKRNLGLDVVASNKEWQAYLASQQRLEYQISRAGWIGDYLDPNTFLDMWVTKGGNNQTGWANPLYDRLIQACGDPRAFTSAPDDLLKVAKEPERLRQRLESFAKAEGNEAELAALDQIRFHLFREAEAILLQDAVPVIPIYSYQVSGLIRTDVEGFYSEIDMPNGTKGPNLQDLHPFRYVKTPRAGGGG